MKKSKFTKNVLTLMTGATVAQAIPIAFSPILTRLYTPKDFGVFALFIAITSIFASIANGKYELAIMLPRKDEDAINIMALGFIINIVVSLSLFFIIMLFHNNILNLLNNKKISPWLYLVPFSVFLIGNFNLLNYFNNRKKFYKDLAKVKVYKSIGMAIVQLVLGFLKAGVAGLISGQIFSQIVSNIKLFFNIKKLNLFSTIKKGKIIALAKKYKVFPKFTLWAGLANTLSTNVTNILISSLFSIATLGYYSLVQKILGMPSALIGNSIGQVLFQQATEEKNSTGGISNSFNVTLKKLIIIAIPLFLILFFTVEDLFVFAFGEKWEIAGVYAKIMLPLFIIRFIVSPLTVMNQVNLKNKLGMQWQFGLLFLYISIIFVCKYYGLTFKFTLRVLVIIITVYYLFFLYLINKHVKESK